MKKLMMMLIILAAIIGAYACDMMGMIAKDGYTISDLTEITDDLNDPFDYFEFIKSKSASDENDDGIGLVYYNLDESSLKTYVSDFVGSYNGYGLGNSPYFDGWTPYSIVDYDSRFFFIVGTDTQENENHYDYSNENYNGHARFSIDLGVSYIMNNYFEINWNIDVPSLYEINDPENSDTAIVMAHARTASSSNFKLANHPFYKKINTLDGERTFTFMHNGSLSSDLQDAMGIYDSEFENNWSVDIEDQIDSEKYFEYLMHYIKLNHSLDNDDYVVDGIKEALTQKNVNGIDINYLLMSEFEQNTGNFVMSDSEKLYLFRNASSSSHSLSYKDNGTFWGVKTEADSQAEIALAQFDLVVLSRDEDPVVYPNFLNDEKRSFEGGYNWVCFPKIDLLNNTGQNVNILPMLSELTPNPSTADIEKPGYSSTYNSNNNSWDPESFSINSTNGVKLQLPSAMTIPEYVRYFGGEKIADSTSVNILGNGTPNWIGYFIQDTQTVADAFGDQLDNMYSIQAQDWAMVREKPLPGYPWLYSVGAKKTPYLHYGEMVIVKAFQNDPSFQWNYIEPYEGGSREKTEFFTYEEEADYVPIFVDLEQDRTGLPQEIGIMVDGECKGAAVVDSSFVQINGYILNDSNSNIEFELYYGSRAENRTVKKYYVKTNDGILPENRIRGGVKKDYYRVSFDREYQANNSTPDNSSFTMEAYPNPFNPTTTISFFLPETQNVNIEIFNIKGQKIKTLWTGKADSGKNSVVWHGKDSTDKTVSSGMYFYRISTENETKTKKLMLLK